MPKIIGNIDAVPQIMTPSALADGGIDPFQGPDGRFMKGTHWRPRRIHWDLNWLAEEYLVKLRAVEDIAKEAGITHEAVRHWLRRHGIPSRSVSDARKIKYWGSSGAANGMYGRTGSKNPNWRGGITPERQLFYVSQEWKSACCSVWKRDNATCQFCKTPKSSMVCHMNVHHIESFAVVEKRADVDNLVLLCRLCHDWVHSRENVDRLFLIGEHK